MSKLQAKKQLKISTSQWMLAAPAVLLILSLVIIPSIQMIIQSFLLEGEVDPTLTTENFLWFFSSSVGQKAAFRSVRVSLIVTLITLFAGYPIAFALAKMRSRFRSILFAIILFL